MMVKLVAAPVHIERKIVTHFDSFGQSVGAEHLGYTVTFIVMSGRVSGEFKLPMSEQPILGEEYEITIASKRSL